VLQSHAYLIRNARELYGLEPWEVAGGLYGHPDPIESTIVLGVVRAWLGTPFVPPGGSGSGIGPRAVVVDYSLFGTGQMPTYDQSTDSWVPGSGAGVSGIGSVVFTQPVASVRVSVPYRVPAPRALSAARLNVGVASTGQSLIVTVLRNNVVIATLTMPANDTVEKFEALSVPLVAGDKLQAQTVQAGSTPAQRVAVQLDWAT
jgi:hypothetical protein